MTKADNFGAIKLSTTSKDNEIYASLTEADFVRGKNGKAIYHDFSRLPEESKDCSRQEINRAYRVRE